MCDCVYSVCVCSHRWVVGSMGICAQQGMVRYGALDAVPYFTSADTESINKAPR